MRKAIGKDLSRIALPVILNEPLGLLQKLCEEIEYSDLLDRAAQTDDEHLRLVYVGAFIISTYSSNYYRTGRKNFNPLLGETYECIREDKGWKFIAEQVISFRSMVLARERERPFRYLGQSSSTDQCVHV